MSIINPALTEGNGRYLNKADFTNQTGLFGYHMNQSLGAINPSTTSRDNIPTFLTDDTHTFILEERQSFGTNGRTMLVNDHIGNYNRSGAFVESGGTSEFGMTTLGDNLLFSTGLADFSDKFSIAFWMRLRNNATGNNNKGTVINWNSGTANNGTQTGNIFLWRDNTNGHSLMYNSNGDLSFPNVSSTAVTITPPAVADWIHFALVKDFNGGIGNYNVYVNGVKTTIAFSGTSAWSNIAYNEAATALNAGSTFTFDLSEIWLTSEGTDGYGGTVWDDAQVLKMYEIGTGLFRIPDFTTQTKENNATYGTFTWVAPANVTEITVTAAGAGGGGGNFSFGNNVSTNRACSGGGGGGGAAWLFEESITIVPGETYTFVCADGTNSASGTDTTIAGLINGSTSIVSIDGGKVGGDGFTANDNTTGGTGGVAGTSETTGGETTVAGANGGAGGGTSGGVATGSAGSAGGNTTVDGSTISGGSGGSGGSTRRRGGGGGGGASLTAGSNGGGGSNAAAAGNSGGGGGGGGFLIGTIGGTGSRGTGGAGGFTFSYSLPKESTDNPLIGP